MKILLNEKSKKIIKPIMAYIERWLPFITACVVTFIVYKYKFTLNSLANYSQLFSNTIDFSSIFIGVLMTLVGLILGFSSKAVIKRIKTRDADSILISYFVKPVVSGMIVVIFSLFLNNYFDEMKIKQLYVSSMSTMIWVYCTTYFFSSTIRVLYLMLMILKEVFYEDITEQEKREKSEEENNLNFDDDCFS